MEKKNIYVLGIETSCDETSVSVVLNGRKLLSNAVDSQIDIHKVYGGVVPEIASRNHTMRIVPVLDEAIKLSGVPMPKIDAIAVTQGPGLLGSLLVGVSAAKALSYALSKPLVAVNHIKAHIAANYLAFPRLKPPFLCLVVSGGHTSILRTDSFTEHTLIGRTADDAVGEAFDKVGRKLGLEYPAGPKIDALAKEGKPDITFIKPNKSPERKYIFSFSGLKTAVINYLNKLSQKGEPVNSAEVCASFQFQALEPLIKASIDAAKESGLKKIVLAGGVAANSYLRERMTVESEKAGMRAYFPPLPLCTDNAAMVASLGYYNLLSGVGISGMTLNADANLKF